jgi:hypothetical protein
MSINVKVYDNGDHTYLVWLPADGKPIAGCRGFTARRLLNGTESYLHGMVGFFDGEQLPAEVWKFPLQRYTWSDYGVKPGDAVQYSIVPVTGADKDHLQLATADASALTAPMKVTGQASPNVSAYFNKGIVAAQWVTRALKSVGKNAKLADLIGTVGDPLRNELSGLLRPQLLALLDDVKKNNGEIYAALYELNDPELIAGLTALGQKCHLLLANGAFKPPDNDENKVVREQLRNKVDMHDRLVTGDHFAHNKFVVVCDSSGTAQRVLSGSTNWTKTGLCTQANNGVIVDHPGLAADFVNQWKLLKDAGPDYPPSLGQANATSEPFNIDGGKITQWFAPTSAGQDLDYARKLIDGAKEGILFLFFNPGGFVAADQPEKWTLLQNILSRHQSDSPNYNPALYMRGVVNQEIANLTTDGANAGGSAKQAAQDPASPAPVTLFNGGDQPPQRVGYEAMVPKNIKTAFHDFAAESLGSGVHVHSKVIVLDPFGKTPVVMTGSHNLGYKASTKNDDNLMIIEGNAPLAVAFAANIIAIYQTYRWNASVEIHRQDPKFWHGLADDDQWQSGHLQGASLAEIQFWFGQPPATAGTPAAPASGGPPVNSASAGPAPAAPGKQPPVKKTPVKKAPAKTAPVKRKKTAKKKNKAPAKKKKKTTKKKRPA